MSTIKQYFKTKKGSWIIDCDTSQPYRAMTVNVGFVNDTGNDDETQFDINAYDINELSNLFNIFCKENNFPTNTVRYVRVVQVAEKFEDLQ